MRRRQRLWQWLRLPEGLRPAPLSQFDTVAERTEGRNCRDAGRGDDRGEQTAHTYVKACYHSSLWNSCRIRRTMLACKHLDTKRLVGECPAFS